MLDNINIIIDFDSTFTKVEGLDELANIALVNNPNREVIVAQIKRLTEAGMNGEISFAESLTRRVKMLQANETHITALIEFLRENVTGSILRNKAFFRENQARIYVLSGGFYEFIAPVVTELGILPNHIFANNFRFNSNGNIIGVDEINLLAHDGGKVKTVQMLGLSGETIIIGDGFTDYEIKRAGLATKFYAFTENVRREKVVEVADKVVSSFDEFLLDLG
ncbi:MAG: HAD-IB family phosphatase [Pyrinomonadaceae bacterium]|nr:HAD-IB family phosphatase [Pyrinomonadaceae bacterium]